MNGQARITRHLREIRAQIQKRNNSNETYKITSTMQTEPNQEIEKNSRNSNQQLQRDSGRYWIYKNGISCYKKEKWGNVNEFLYIENVIA